MLSLTVDGNGNVWAGSWTDGAHKYDGVAWVTYDASNSDLMGDQIECFAVEQDSIMWIANHTSSTGGVSRYDGTAWTNYNPGNSGIGDHRIYSISISGDDKYFGTGILGVSKFDGASWSFYATSNEPHCNYITSIDRDNAGSIYFGTMFYGVAVLNAGTWSYYYSGNSGLGDDYVNCVYVDPTGTLWVGTQYSGAYKYDGMSWTNYNTSNSGLLGDIILSITMDSLGNLWLGTAGWDGPGGQNGALAKFDGSTWTNYYLENSGLIDDDGLTVTVDHGDTVWVGTEEGVSKFNQFTGSWTDYTTADGLVDNRVERIAIDSKNDKWFATLGGVSKFDGASWKSYTETDGIASNSVKDIAVEADKVWIATANGMSVFEEGAWATYRQTDGLVDNNVTSVRVDASGYAWFGTDRSGISRFDDSGAGVPATEGPARLRLVAYPNPFTDNLYVRYEAQVGGEAGHAVKIYDLSGRLVRSIQPLSSGSGTIMWDGKNETGQEITTGIYFIRVQTASGKTLGTEKAIFVR
jgi:ligand-binding sensor domain-containing protein